jgi:hypothetical protein
MSERTAVLDRGEEEFPAYEASDEVLEAAGTMAIKGAAYSFSFCTSPYVCPWSLTIRSSSPALTALMRPSISASSLSLDVTAMPGLPFSNSIGLVPW